MTPAEIARDNDPESSLSAILAGLHKNGPANAASLERVSLYKRLHPEAFAKIEEKVVASMGLFYKLTQPNSLYSFLLMQMGKVDEVDGKRFTPIQRSVLRAVQDHKYVSISAPTSSGKSYSIRDFIVSSDGDAVVVVPSRALIAEYLTALRRECSEHKHVMIVPFVDRIYTSRVSRRVFVLTPERARELFELRESVDVRLFFFDEAQVSEEPARGITFDVLVRRVSKIFPDAKLVFAHPFVKNPGAQFSKHNLPSSLGYSRSYPYGAVGKICVFRHQNGKDYFFSPFESSGHRLSNCLELVGGFESFAFSKGHSILVYVTKASIYDGRFIHDFAHEIENFATIESEDALRIVAKISTLVGADSPTHKSNMIELMKKGVVIHHGSVPLEVRFLIEDYIRRGFARICFATSTLVQGINMPFDIIWLKSSRFLGDSHGGRSLAFKNLVGRAGRSTAEPRFDFGYIFTSNPQLVREYFADDYVLSDASVIESSQDTADVLTNELLESVREGTFNQELNLPEKRVTRLSGAHVIEAARRVLEALYAGDGSRKDVSGSYGRIERMAISNNLQVIFEASLGRTLLAGEQSVFTNAISIMLMAFQGIPFSQIVGIRFSQIARSGIKSNAPAAFAQRAYQLPDIRLARRIPLFTQIISAKDVPFDTVVFDTYDYLDQVISFSLSDVFIASFTILNSINDDPRSSRFIELIKFGTNDPIDILLMRYGFQREDVPEVRAHIASIDEGSIVFRDSISGANEHVKNVTAWYR